MQRGGACIRVVIDLRLGASDQIAHVIRLKPYHEEEKRIGAR